MYAFKLKGKPLWARS